jgi:hypothetical protein
MPANNADDLIDSYNYFIAEQNIPSNFNESLNWTYSTTSADVGYISSSTISGVGAYSSESEELKRVLKDLQQRIVVLEQHISNKSTTLNQPEHRKLTAP